ncbi:flagellar protein FliT [Oceanobacillus halophilus]|uniref:Flagellar protein FliT n=1 Tax=Oceanobacillus halophilus TaxID=930130 RepID=A0A495A823_9BACI|nr:flagellar protein FliT [Oceanobacillus halophilus]RKQ35571.1 flagellar protein FliT [Oceanobacillus halophilus]
MNPVQKIYDITVEMKNLLDKDIPSNQREDSINKVHELLHARAKCMEQLESPFTEEEKEIGKELVTLNKDIQTMMNKLSTELKSEMKQVKRQKKTNQSYINPYRNVQVMDGMYMDKKK